MPGLEGNIGGAPQFVDQPAGVTPPNPPATEDNAGAADALANFWTQEEPAAAPSGSQTPATPPAQQPDGMSAIVANIEKFKPASIMTPEVIAKMGTGDFADFEAGLAQTSQQVLQESARMTAGLFKEIVPQIIQHMQGMIESKFGATDQKAFLETNVPAARDPKTASMVTQVYERALTLAKGDRTKALETTKDMLAAMSSVINPQDSNGPPSVPGGGNRQQPKTDWFAELGVAGR